MKLLLVHGADVIAASSPDTRNARNNLADTVAERLNSSFGVVGQASARAASAASPRPRARYSSSSNASAEHRWRRTHAAGLCRARGLPRVRTNPARHGADVNQTTHYGWTPLLAATQNRHYKLAAYLLEHGANPNIANNGGWTPLYLATDNRNIESGDYPVRAPDMDHLEFIKLLLAKGADVNARICERLHGGACTGDTTETRNNFTMQWLYEDGATPFLRAAQSGDIPLMKLLLSHGADPKIFTAHNVTPLAVASGIGWVEGVTFEWSRGKASKR